MCTHIVLHCAARENHVNQKMGPGQVPAWCSDQAQRCRNLEPITREMRWARLVKGVSIASATAVGVWAIDVTANDDWDEYTRR
jgi:hypothetical protein